jgi:hypothetical protein
LVIDIHDDEGIVDLHDGNTAWRAPINDLTIEGEQVDPNISAEDLEELLLPYSTDDEGAEVSWSDVGGNIFGNTDLTKYFIFGNTAYKDYDEIDLKNLYKEIILLNREALSYDPTFQRAQGTIRAYGAHFTDLEGNSVALSAYGPHIPQEDYLPQIDIKAANGAHVIIKPSTLLLEDEVGNQLVITATSQFGSAQTVYDNTEDTNSVERRITSTGKVGFYVVEKLVMKGPFATTDLIINPETDALYLVGTNSPYETYAYIDGALVQLGTTQIELDDYYTKAETQSYVEGSYYNKIAINNRFDLYYTSVETNNYVIAALAAYETSHDSTLAGKGTTSDQLKVADPLMIGTFKAMNSAKTYLTEMRDNYITRYQCHASGGQAGPNTFILSENYLYLGFSDYAGTNQGALQIIHGTNYNEIRLIRALTTDSYDCSRYFRSGRLRFTTATSSDNIVFGHKDLLQCGDFSIINGKYCDEEWLTINSSRWKVRDLAAGSGITLAYDTASLKYTITADGSGTMTVVEHDSTLEGDGTSTNELRVAVPFNPNNYYTSSQIDTYVSYFHVKDVTAGDGIVITDQNNGVWEIEVDPNEYYTISQLETYLAGTYHVKDITAGSGIQITDQSNGSWQITQIPTLGETFTLTKTVGTVAASARPLVENNGITGLYPTIRRVDNNSNAGGYNLYARNDGTMTYGSGDYVAAKYDPNGTLRVKSTDTTNGTVTFSATDGVVAGYRFVSVWATKSSTAGDITCDILSGVGDDGLITSSASVQVQYRNESISSAASDVKIHLTLAQPVTAITSTVQTDGTTISGDGSSGSVLSVTNPFNPSNYYTSSQLDQVISTYHVKDLSAGSNITITDQNYGTWEIGLPSNVLLTEDSSTGESSIGVTGSMTVVAYDTPRRLSNSTVLSNEWEVPALNDFSTDDFAMPYDSGNTSGKIRLKTFSTELKGPYDSTDDITEPYNPMYMYMVGTASPYSLYAYIDPDLVLVGSTDTDLSDYKVMDLTAGNNVTLTYDGTTKKYTIASREFEHNATLTGDGTSTSPLGINVGGGYVDIPISYDAGLKWRYNDGIANEYTTLKCLHREQISRKDTTNNTYRVGGFNYESIFLEKTGEKLRKFIINPSLSFSSSASVYYAVTDHDFNTSHFKVSSNKIAITEPFVPITTSFVAPDGEIEDNSWPFYTGVLATANPGSSYTEKFWFTTLTFGTFTPNLPNTGTYQIELSGYPTRAINSSIIMNMGSQAYSITNRPNSIVFMTADSSAGAILYYEDSTSKWKIVSGTSEYLPFGASDGSTNYMRVLQSDGYCTGMQIVKTTGTPVVAARMYLSFCGAYGSQNPWLQIALSVSGGSAGYTEIGQVTQTVVKFPDFNPSTRTTKSDLVIAYSDSGVASPVFYNAVTSISMVSSGFYRTLTFTITFPASPPATMYMDFKSYKDAPVAKISTTVPIDNDATKAAKIEAYLDSSSTTHANGTIKYTRIGNAPATGNTVTITLSYIAFTKSP